MSVRNESAMVQRQAMEARALRKESDLLIAATTSQARHKVQLQSKATSASRILLSGDITCTLEDWRRVAWRS